MLHFTRKIKQILIVKTYICSTKIRLIIMKLFLLTIGLLALGVAGIAIKIWAKKDGEFSGTCASQNPMLNESGEACGFCGKTPDQFETCSEPQHN